MKNQLIVYLVMGIVIAMAIIIGVCAVTDELKDLTKDIQINKPNHK